MEQEKKVLTKRSRWSVFIERATSTALNRSHYPSVTLVEHFSGVCFPCSESIIMRFLTLERFRDNPGPRTGCSMLLPVRIQMGSGTCLRGSFWTVFVLEVDEQKKKCRILIPFVASRICLFCCSVNRIKTRKNC